MRDRLHKALKEEGGPVSYAKLASNVLKIKGLSEEACRELLEPLMKSNPHFRLDENGFWKASETLLHERFLPDVTFSVVDIETTGGRPPQHRITELAAVKVRDGKVVDEFNALVNPGRDIPRSVVRLTGITDAMLENQPGLSERLPRFLDFIEDSVFVAHCANFDFHFIQYFAREFLDHEFRPPVLCTFKLAQRLVGKLGRYNLGDLAAYLGIAGADRHRALADAQATAKILLRFLRMIQIFGLETLEDVLDFQEMPPKEAPLLAEGLSLDPAVLNDLPSGRGVFRLLDARGETVYAGKGPDLKRAVRDLFYPKNRSSARFAKKLCGVKRVETRRIESELGMSLQTLRAGRDSKLANGAAGGLGTGFLLKVGLASRFPRISVVKKLAADGGAYYGPFRKLAQIRELVDAIHSVFPLRLESRGEKPPPEEKGRKERALPQSVSPQVYERMVGKLQALLEGRFRRSQERGLLSLLEKAWGGRGPSPASLKRNLNRLRHLLQNHSLGGPSVERRTLVIVESGESLSRRVCYIVRAGYLVDELEFGRGAPPAEELKARLHAALFDPGRGEPPPPGKEDLEEASVIAAWLRRELIDGFVVEVTGEAEEGDVFETVFRSINDPNSAGAILSV